MFSFSTNLFSQSDTLKTKTKFGCSVGLINFVDYGFLKESIVEKNAYYQGFDINLFIRPEGINFQINFGVLGGDKYPVIENLNYYFGIAYLRNLKNKKNILEIDPKVMYSYSIKPYNVNSSIVRKELSFQIGINVYRKARQLEFGLGYYLWVSNSITIIRQFDFFTANESYNKCGFVPIGILKVSARFTFNK